MKKKKISLLISTGAGLLGATAITAATAISLASCTTTTGYDKSIAKQLYNSYNNEYSAAMGNQMYYQLTAENQPKVTTITQNYLSKVNSVIDSVKDTFGLDEQIWLRSFKFYLQTKLKLLQSNIRYVIVSRSDMLTMTNYAGTFQSQIARAARNYYSSSGAALSYDTVTTNLNGVNQYINDIYANLKDGLADGTTWSGVMTKHTIGSILQQLYATDLNTWVSAGESRGDLKSVLKGTLFTSNTNKTKWVDTLSDETQKTTINNLVETVQNSLDKLTKFLMNEYFSGIKYGNVYNSTGNTTMTLDFKVQDSNPNEEDNGYSYTNGSKTYYISGLGLSTQDLEVKDIGIGFSGTNGQAIYKALLQKHSNVEDADPAEQYKFGNDQVADILAAMKSVANTIANIHVGSNNKWEATYMYDEDSSGDAKKSESVKATIREANAEVKMTEFFKWLNGDQWFNGRDMTTDQFPTLDGKTELEAKGEENNTSSGASTDSTPKKPYTYTPYWTNKDLVASVIGYKGDENANSTTTWGDAGNLYVKYITNGLSAATIQSSSTIMAKDMNNDISAAAAYIGSSHAVSQYLTYKNDVISHITGAFKTTPINWTLRSGVGGAAYASSGDGQSNWVDEGYGGFYLDVNPYFGLQKWSMSTLTNHEAVSGHVFQFAYASTHPADEDAVSITSTAYAEGWGLFSEWLPTQMGVYGQPTTLATAALDANNNITSTSNMLTLPKFGTKSQTTNVALLSTDYANGAYVVKKTTAATEAETTTDTNNQAYYDALQYFGFLNERQLRAMRIAVDVGLHAGTSGNFTAGTGYSLNDARTYLRSNSGLGIDDVNRETKRYLEYIGQATSYYNGLDKMQSYFLKAKALYEKANPNSTYMNWEDTSATQANTQDLFDLILRNNNVQLPALTWAVDKYLSEKYPTTSNN